MHNSLFVSIIRNGKTIFPERFIIRNLVTHANVECSPLYMSNKLCRQLFLTVRSNKPRESSKLDYNTTIAIAVVRPMGINELNLTYFYVKKKGKCSLKKSFVKLTGKNYCPLLKSITEFQTNIKVYFFISF